MFTSVFYISLFSIANSRWLYIQPSRNTMMGSTSFFIHLITSPEPILICSVSLPAAFSNLVKSLKYAVLWGRSYLLSINSPPYKFPGAEDAKIPTIMYYDQQGKVRAAGAEAMSESIDEKAVEENWTKSES